MQDKIEPIDSRGALVWANLTRLFPVFLICYLYELAHFNLSIDEEVFAFARPEKALELGRWTQALVRKWFWPQPSVPFGPFVIFGLFACLGYMLFLRALNVRVAKLRHIVVFPLFIAFPVWFTQVEFSINILPFGLALALCCGAAFLFSLVMPGSTRPRHPQAALLYPLVVSLVTIAVGVYQSFVLFFAVLAVGIAVTFYVRGEIKRGAGYLAGLVVIALISGLALLLSQGIARILGLVYGIPLSKYAKNFIDLGAFLTAPGHVMAQTLDQVYMIYAGYWRPFAWAEGIFLAIPCFGLAAFGILAVRRRDIRLGVALLTLGLLLLIPFGFNLFMGGSLPMRVFIATPAVVTLLLLLPLELLRNRRVTGAALILAGLAFLHILYIQSMVQARAWVTQQYDLYHAHAIHQRIMLAAGPHYPPGPIKVDFGGCCGPAALYPAVWSSSSSGSFFEWGNGNPNRMVSFMNLLGLSPVTRVSPAERQQLRSVYENLPVYPAEGSVALVRDVVVVKLGETITKSEND